MLTSLGFAALCLSASFSSAARATTIFSNINATHDGADLVASDSDSGSGPLAQSFTTGSSTFDLRDLSLSLAGVQDSGAVLVSIAQDDNTAPGNTVVAQVATIADTRLSAIPSIYDFAFATPVQLDAATRYWVELAAAPGGSTSAEWSYSYNVSGVGTASEFTFNNYNGTPGPGVADSSSGLYQMCLSDTARACAPVILPPTTNQSIGEPPALPSPPSPDAPPPPPPPPTPIMSASDVAVPEPTTIAIFVTALGGLALLRRRSPESIRREN